MNAVDGRAEKSMKSRTSAQSGSSLGAWGGSSGNFRAHLEDRQQCLGFLFLRGFVLETMSFDEADKDTTQELLPTSSWSVRASLCVCGCRVWVAITL